MKLEQLFFKSFFYPFLAGIFLSSLVILIFLGFFTNNFNDKRTKKNIIDLEKKNSKITINNSKTLVTTYVSNLQISLNELINFYKKLANDILRDENSQTFQTDFLISYLSTDEEFCEDYYSESQYMGVWLLDQYRTNDNLDDSVKDVKLKLIACSNIIPNINSILEVTLNYAYPYYFYFEKTELYMTYPLSDECDFRWMGDLSNFSEFYENTECIDENAEYHKVYKMKCQESFLTMLKSKTNAFDNNYLLSQNKTIFINNFYFDIPIYEYHELSMCIEFEDPITNGKAYACLEASYDDLNFSLDELNYGINGYFFISNVGFNHVFFFPLSTSTSKIPTDYIFGWNFDFYLDEKVNFYYHIKNYFTSNYIDKIGNNLNDEIYINGNNSNEQYFYVNGTTFN